jgi:hypothetical protein
MDRETIKSFATRMVDNDRMRSLAERTGLYTPPRSLLGRELALMAAGIGVGAMIMYLLDPEQGRRRRTIARDQVTSFVTETERKIQAKARDYQTRARDYSNRARGVVAEAKNAVRESSQPF